MTKKGDKKQRRIIDPRENSEAYKKSREIKYKLVDPPPPKQGEFRPLRLTTYKCPW